MADEIQVSAQASQLLDRLTAVLRGRQPQILDAWPLDRYVACLDRYPELAPLGYQSGEVQRACEAIRGVAGDAGLDLYARESATLVAGGGRALVPTGIAIAIPMGHGGFVLPRSGMAVKHGISVVNGPGLIDAAYRGEIKVVLINTDPDTDYEVHRGDRIAQLVVQRVESVAWQVVDSLDGVDRGGGFGHSGR